LQLTNAEKITLEYGKSIRAKTMVYLWLIK
jgi:hypothetical protein